MTSALTPTDIVPPPPAAFNTDIMEVPVGARLWSIYDARFAEDAFNLGKDASQFTLIGTLRKPGRTDYAADAF